MDMADEQLVKDGGHIMSVSGIGRPDGILVIRDRRGSELLMGWTADGGAISRACEGIVDE